ncbi:hypothetical protein QR685DRAFT_573340 [Neurospora intermedia]|uniref:Uncharacterized protein n=1 Tax=Neurospora intermedia TaxID=5142 RepID=A0ABR3D8W9_NEUIN
MPCYAEDREISRDKEYQPEWGTDRCRCVCLYTSKCSETQECKSYTYPVAITLQGIPPRLYKTGQVTSWAGVHCMYTI